MADLKIFTDNIEDAAKKQIDLLLEQEAFKDCKIRIMPDVHAGAGCVIGFTGDLGDKVIPNIVGVDIGCGMLCAELDKVDLDLEKLDHIIHTYVPSGFEVHKERKYDFKDLQELKCYNELKDVNRLERSIGTLGGGNHFIEVDEDDEGNKYLVIHTGSRNLGKQVAEYYQNLAHQLCNFNKSEYDERYNAIIEEYKASGREKEISKAISELKNEYMVNKNRIPKELAYLEGQYREDYLHDMRICQRFAYLNRYDIMNTILENLLDDPRVVTGFETIHNYISFEDGIVRKGAISCEKDKTVLIPMNMRDGCIIGIGKGNPDWNCSGPHGAGRIMSRIQAKKTLNIDEYKESMKDIYSTSVDETTIDEAPMVYKPMEEILKYIDETVEVIKIIKPIYNFKASEVVRKRDKK